jgi:DNA-binding IclR family transcriptional regulator
VAEVDERLDEELLRALRRAPDRKLDELASRLDLPRTNFGRRLDDRLRGPLDRLVAGGLVEEHDGRYRLSPRGRALLAERALGDDGGA